MRTTLVALLLVAATACGTEDGPTPAGMPKIVRTPTFRYEATVREVLDAGSYTYARVAFEGVDRWVVGLRTNLSIGQTVAVKRFGTKSDFCSQRVDRCFETLDFAFLSVEEKP